MPEVPKVPEVEKDQGHILNIKYFCDSYKTFDTVALEILWLG